MDSEMREKLKEQFNNLHLMSERVSTPQETLDIATAMTEIAKVLSDTGAVRSAPESVSVPT